jgi:hypothetical protein
MPDLNEFLEWVKQGPKRKVRINVENGKISADVWDYSIGYMFQTVKTVSEIDLQKVNGDYELKEYQRLKSKYEPEAVNQ